MSMTKFVLSASLLLIVPLGSVHSAERPTLNHTCDPRPDILPHPFYYAHTEFRRAYNRPREITGWIASKISATSQEAMVWRENMQAGNYDHLHMPPMYKRYYYLKPWEALQTGARPDFVTTSTANSRQSPNVEFASPETLLEENATDQAMEYQRENGSVDPAGTLPVPEPPKSIR